MGIPNKERMWEQWGRIFYLYLMPLCGWPSFWASEKLRGWVVIDTLESHMDPEEIFEVGAGDHGETYTLD